MLNERMKRTVNSKHNFFFFLVIKFRVPCNPTLHIKAFVTGSWVLECVVKIHFMHTLAMCAGKGESV